MSLCPSGTCQWPGLCCWREPLSSPQCDRAGCAASRPTWWPRRATCLVGSRPARPTASGACTPRRASASPSACSARSGPRRAGASTSGMWPSGACAKRYSGAANQRRVRTDDCSCPRATRSLCSWASEDDFCSSTTVGLQMAPFVMLPI